MNFKAWCLWTGLLIGLAGCGGSPGPSGPGGVPAPNAVTGVSITPNSVTLDLSQTSQFNATVSGTGTFNTNVTWTCTAGTISGTGLFRAPGAPGTFTVKAVSQGDNSKVAIAMVTVKPAPQVTSVAVSPHTGYVSIGSQIQFTAVVSGVGAYNPNVRWWAGYGKISSTGLYTAPRSGLTDIVKAFSVSNPGIYDQVTITVGSLGYSVKSIQIAPTPVRVKSQGTQQFVSTVRYYSPSSGNQSTTNPAWSVFSAELGTVDPDGTYHAPLVDHPTTDHVIARAKGDLSKSATATVNLDAGYRYSYTVCDPSKMPLWVAYQTTSNSDWKLIMPTGNTYSFLVPEGPFALAVVDSTGAGGTIFYATTADPAPFPTGCGQGASVNVKGTLGPLSQNQPGTISLGEGQTTILGTGPNSFPSFTVSAQTGTSDLFATLGHDLTGPGGDNPPPSKVIVKRNLSVSAAMTLGSPLDFGLDGVDTFLKTLSVTGSTSQELVSANVSYKVRGGSALQVSQIRANSIPGGSTLFWDYAGIPTPPLDTTRDLYLASATATGTNGSNVFLRTVQKNTFSQFFPSSVALPPALGSASTSIRFRSPYIRPGSSWTNSGGYRNIGLSFQQSYKDAQGQQKNKGWDVELTGAYLQATPGAAYVLPDFSPVPGWDNAWALLPGVPMDWTVSGNTFAPGIWRSEMEFGIANVGGTIQSP